MLENDLFKKFKLKHYRPKLNVDENDDNSELNYSDGWTSKSTTPDLEVESRLKLSPRFSTIENNTRIDDEPHLFTPDISELQKREDELLRSLTIHQSKVFRLFFAFIDVVLFSEERRFDQRR